MSGKVYLVGAGPGDPELLTLKALKVLKSADVVLHDALISPEVLAFIPATARIQDVGKRCGQKSTPQEQINRLLINYARLDLQVVRLKGGDPMIFGRSGEEMEALRQAHIDFEIVPGITAALGAAAAARIPLTYREVSSALVFLTSHRSKPADDHKWPSQLPSNATVVIYMPGGDHQRTQENLRQAGVRGTTPCAIISHAASADERVHTTTVDDLSSAPQLPAPSLLVVGEVARLADHASLKPSVWPSETAEKELFSLLAQAGFLAQHRQEYSQPQFPPEPRFAEQEPLE